MSMHDLPANLTNSLAFPDTFQGFLRKGAWMHAWSDTLPPDGTAGYHKGCIFVDTDATTGGTLAYVNNGTATSCAFVALGSGADNLTIAAGKTLTVTDADKLLVGGVIVPQVLELAFKIAPNATVTEYDIWIAPAAYRVTSIKYVPSTLQGGAMTATVVKATGTATPVNSTTPMHTANAIDLNAGAYTVVTPTLTVTAADLILAAGDRISIDYSAAPTAAHWALAITVKRV